MPDQLMPDQLRPDQLMPDQLMPVGCEDQLMPSAGAALQLMPSAGAAPCQDDPCHEATSEPAAALA